MSVASPDAGLATPSVVAPCLDVTLLGGFHLSRDGRRTRLAPGGQRVVALLALHGTPVQRSLIAATLWPDVPERKAFANLRATLSRLEGTARLALDVTLTELALADGVAVDLHIAQAAAQRILEPGGAAAEAARGASPVAALSAELLPGWYDDWALFAIEDWHRLRVHALEVLAPELCRAGRLAAGAAAARAAVRADPLRESARAVLMAAYAAAGDRCAAIREFAEYDALVRSELGISPSSSLTAAVGDLMRDAADDRVGVGSTR